MTGTIWKIIAIAPPLLISVMLHEIAHGLAAQRLGDPTARQLGRITFNPLRHIDPMMTIILPALLIFAGSPVVFGGAKPVPVNPYYFANPRRGMAYVALAGPLSNICLSVISYLLLHGVMFIEPHLSPILSVPLTVVELWLIFGVIINLVLAIFNLLPVPPLDGGRIAVGFLPLSLARSFARMEPFGLLIVFWLLYSGVLDKVLDPVLGLLNHLPLFAPGS